jgi:hypothetical protein
MHSHALASLFSVLVATRRPVLLLRMMRDQIFRYAAARPDDSAMKAYRPVVLANICVGKVADHIPSVS